VFRFTQLITDSNKKVPFSKDNKFQFVSYNVSKENLADFLSSSFYLNHPLADDIITCERKKEFLRYKETSNYFILDIDHVDTLAQFKKVVNYFLFNDFPVFLITSRSFNNTDCFNMKGIFYLKDFLSRDIIKSYVKTINKHLKNICSIDEHVLNASSYQAPTKNSKIILDNLNGNGKLTLEVFEEKQIDFVIPSSSDIEKDWALQKFTEMGFRRVRDYKNNNGSFQFSHYSEKKTKNGYFWFENSPFIMHHHDKNKSVNIFKEFANTLTGKKFLKEQQEQRLRDKLYSKFAFETIHKVDKQYLSVDEKTIEFIEAFLSKKHSVALKIKSFMGSGKSNIIEEVLKRKNRRILFLSNRINSTIDYSERYNIKTYLDDDYVIGDSLIVQIESLWKYDLRNFDIVIIDEFCSVLFQNLSTLSTKQRQTIKKFMSIFTNKMPILLADAFLLGFENNFLSEYDSILKIENKRKDQQDCSLFVDTDEQTLIKTIIEDNDKISVSTTSKSFAIELKKQLELKGKKVLFVSGDLSIEHKKEILKIIGEKEREILWDVLIYSPTITVGVNILNHYKRHYHYDCSSSCDVISSLQMIKRVRNVEKVFLYVKKSQFKNLPIEHKILDKIMEEDFKNIEFESYDEYGNIVPSEEQYFVNKIRAFSNLLDNSHYFSFRLLLSEQFERVTEVTDKKFVKRLKKSSKDEYITNRLKEIDEIFEGKKTFSEQEKLLSELESIRIRFSKYKTFSREYALELYKESLRDRNFIFTLKRLFIFLKDDKKTLKKRRTELLLESSMSSEENKYKKFLDLCIKFNGMKLKEWYTLNEITEEERTLLEQIGFKQNSKRLELGKKYRDVIEAN
jgi:hypothetical protein